MTVEFFRSRPIQIQPVLSDIGYNVCETFVIRTSFISHRFLPFGYRVISHKALRTVAIGIRTINSIIIISIRLSSYRYSLSVQATSLKASLKSKIINFFSVHPTRVPAAQPAGASSPKLGQICCFENLSTSSSLPRLSSFFLFLRILRIFLA